MNRFTNILLVVTAALLIAADTKDRNSKETPDGKDSARHSETEIQQSIKLLGSDRFSERETATRSLIKIGQRAIPAVTKAANYKDAETSVRAIRILVALYDSDNDKTSYYAWDALESIVKSQNKEAAQRASASIRNIQQRSIQVKVVDEQEKPIAGVTVFWHRKGPRRPLLWRKTNQEGEFFLEKNRADAVKEFLVSINGFFHRPTVIKGETLLLKVAIDQIAIQGIWNVVSPAGKSSKDSKEIVREQTINFNIFGNSLSIWDGERLISEYTFNLDSTKETKEINLKSKEGKTSGIYKLNGNELMICLRKIGNVRPTEFASKTFTANDVLTVLKRYASLSSVNNIKNIEAPENKRIRSALMSRTELDLVNIPLIEVLDHLSKMFNVEFVFDRECLENAGIHLNKSITMRVEGVTFHTMLTMLLKPIKLAYEVDDGAIVLIENRRNPRDKN